MINALGRVFMDPIDDPFRAVEAAIAAAPLHEQADAVIVDFHTEATSEIQGMGFFLDGRATLVVGTHTHIPTSDHRILKGGTALMADAGMCGDYDSIIGVDPDEPLNRFLTGVANGRFTPAEGEATLCGVIVETDPATGLGGARRAAAHRWRAGAGGAGVRLAMQELEPQHYAVAERLFSSFVPDHLSVAAVLERHVEGRVLVDDPAAPTVGLLHGPEGVYLAGGLPPGGDAASLRGAIDGWAYLHIAPDWTGDLAEVFPHPFMLLHERRTFSIATSAFDGPAALPTGFEAERADGFGCRILHEGVVVSRCLPDMVAGDRTEVGIWTHPGYRHRGLALAAAQTALAAAREEGIVVAGWHCVASNRGSAHLAQRLGGVERKSSIAYSASHQPREPSRLATRASSLRRAQDARPRQHPRSR